MPTLRKTAQKNPSNSKKNRGSPMAYNSRQNKSKNNRQGDRAQPYQRHKPLANLQKKCKQSLSEQQNFADKEGSQESSQDISVVENQIPLNSQTNLQKDENANQSFTESNGENTPNSVSNENEKQMKSEVLNEKVTNPNEIMDTDSKELQNNSQGDDQIITTSNNNEINSEAEEQTKGLNDVKSNGSAVTKAFKKFGRNFEGNKKLKKATKVSLSIRRKKLNTRLSKVLIPKSALILLNELRPGCTYKIQDNSTANPAQFLAQVEYNGQILGTGQGKSKAQSKTLAAENAIKLIVSKTMSESFSKPTQKNEGCEKNEEPSNNPAENLPWAGLASFALFKLFSEWQNQGIDFSFTRPTVKAKTKDSMKPEVAKVLPPRAAELHPTTVLNLMKPGLCAVELHRDVGPNSRVTMAYIIDGKTYSGVGNNKKEAKKEAAKAAVSSLWGVKYPDTA